MAGAQTLSTSTPLASTSASGRATSRKLQQSRTSRFQPYYYPSQQYPLAAQAPTALSGTSSVRYHNPLDTFYPLPLRTATWPQSAPTSYPPWLASPGAAYAEQPIGDFPYYFQPPYHPSHYANAPSYPQAAYESLAGYSQPGIREAVYGRRSSVPEVGRSGPYLASGLDGHRLPPSGPPFPGTSPAGASNHTEIRATDHTEEQNKISRPQNNSGRTLDSPI